ncbi:MAG: hypothetical protein GXO77_06640 [Calditrichaeota bacterium]|nr:hypothetical protein [Calditrichota bacterium]
MTDISKIKVQTYLFKDYKRGKEHQFVRVRIRDKADLFAEIKGGGVYFNGGKSTFVNWLINTPQYEPESYDKKLFLPNTDYTLTVMLSDSSKYYCRIRTPDKDLIRFNASALKTVFCHFERREKSYNSNKNKRFLVATLPRNDNYRLFSVGSIIEMIMTDFFRVNSIILNELLFLQNFLTINSNQYEKLFHNLSIAAHLNFIIFRVIRVNNSQCKFFPCSST